MQHQVKNSHLKQPAQQIYPKNWTEMSEMAANIFKSQGKSQQEFFTKLPVHNVQTYFDPKNCSNETLRTYHKAPSKVPIPYMSEFDNFYKNPSKYGSNYNTTSFPNVNRQPFVSHRTGQNFNKKYPRRSETSFKVVPKISTFNDENEEISLNVLQIGPKL
jgi:hypothetical protein